MINRSFVLGACMAAVALLNDRSATAQQPQPLPANAVIANPVTADPIDPASLNAPPAFEDTAPVEKKPVETPLQELAPPKSLPAAETVWKPKLRVVLVTQAGTPDVPVPYHRAEKSAPFSSDFDVPLPGDVKRTAHKITAPAQPFAILMCDEVTVDAKTSETGELAYSVSCKGKVQLQIDDYTVTGDSISSDKGKLTLTNAVVKSDKATLTAEKMQIHLPIFGVRVEPDSAEPSGSNNSYLPMPNAKDEPNKFFVPST